MSISSGEEKSYSPGKKPNQTKNKNQQEQEYVKLGWEPV